ncbi:hypothetical protein EIP86_006496 [Pleurotus ostreatoroseus]|nr:hypothetical protein EIP86_006496 [Pleurotus ostreatoroseus]
MNNQPPRAPIVDVRVTNWREAHNNLQWLERERQANPRPMTEEDLKQWNKLQFKTWKAATRKTGVTALEILKEAVQENDRLKMRLDLEAGGMVWLDLVIGDLEREFESLKAELEGVKQEEADS